MSSTIPSRLDEIPERPDSAGVARSEPGGRAESRWPLGLRDPAAVSSKSVDRRVVRRSKGLGEAAGGDRSADFGGFGADPGVADLVDHDQRDERQPLELGLQGALAFGLTESRDPLGRGRELDALTGEARADRERDREMRFAGPGLGLPQRDHRLLHPRDRRLGPQPPLPRHRSDRGCSSR